jgi:hypothetical protein
LDVATGMFCESDAAVVTAAGPNVGDHTSLNGLSG